MRALSFLLGAVLLGCATTPEPKPSAPVAAEPPPAPKPSTCPTTPPQSDTFAPETMAGAKIEKVCLLGASEDTYLRLHETVAPREGSLMAASVITEDLLALYKQQPLKDVRAYAERLPSKGVVLTWVVVEFDRVGQLKFEGLDAPSEESVRGETSRASFVSDFTLKRFAEVTRAFLQSKGFARATVAVTPEPVRPGLTNVRIVATPGSRVTIGRIRFVGLKQVKEADLKKKLTLTVGAPWFEGVADSETTRVEEVLFDKGLVKSNVELTASEPVGDKVEVTITVTEGDVFKLGKLSLVGHSVGPEAEVLKSFESKTGGVFSRATVQRDIERIRMRATKKGERVNVTPITHIEADTRRIDVQFEVEKVGGSVTF